MHTAESNRHDPDLTHLNYALLMFHMCSSVYILIPQAVSTQHRSFIS